MCLSSLFGGGGDDGAAQARADEAARQARIQSSIGAINSQFDRFNSADFYPSVTKAYLDYYMPQFEDQAAESRRKLLLSSPNTAGSGYARNAGKLEAEIARQQAAIQSQAVDQATTKRRLLRKIVATLSIRPPLAAGFRTLRRAHPRWMICKRSRPRIPR